MQSVLFVMLYVKIEIQTMQEEGRREGASSFVDNVKTAVYC